MKLIGIISHQGTKDHGHYIAMTNRGDEWTSYNDAITTQTTMTHLHQTQAYILLYRKTEQSTGKGEAAPRDSPTMASQPRSTEKPKPRHKTHHREEKPALQPDPPIKTLLEENLPRQGMTDVGANPNPNPTHEEGSTTENQKVLETLLSNCYIPPVLETRGEGEGGGTTERGGVSRHSPKGQTIGSNHFYRKRNRANLRMSLSTYSSPSRSSSTLARDGSKNSPAS